LSAHAWRHVGAGDGFEVAFGRDGGFDGHVSAVEDGLAFALEYSIELRPDWTTRSARVRCRSAAGVAEVAIDADGAGGWTVDGAPAPHVAGCLDVDLEASALTNAFPVARLRLAHGAGAQAPAAYVRVPDMRVERLEQRYVRVGEHEYDYESPAFGFECRLVYDADGFVRDYPGIAVRHDPCT
jgi:uncharacterized protein